MHTCVFANKCGECLTKVTPFGMLCACIVSLPNDSPPLFSPKLPSSPAFPILFSLPHALYLTTFLSTCIFSLLSVTFPFPQNPLSPPSPFPSPSLLHASSPSGWLVSQDALFQAAPLGPSSMGGAWAGRESTDWTLPLRTGALAGQPPSASDGRGR